MYDFFYRYIYIFIRTYIYHSDNCCFGEITLQGKYDHTQDIWLHSRGRQERPHAYASSERKSVLELQLGPTCTNSCFGCRDVRSHIKGDHSFLSDNPESIDRIFDLLVNDGKVWRIQLSGSVTDPLTVSMKTWERVLERSEGHDIILHHGAYDWESFQEKVYDLQEKLLARRGRFVLVRSHNVPIFFDGIVETGAECLLRFSGLGQMQRHLRSGANVHADYLGYQMMIGLFRNFRDNIRVSVDKAPIVIKQLIYQGTGSTPFSIDSPGSVDVQRKAIQLWTSSADTYMIAPAYYQHGQDRVKLQEQFEQWINRVMDSFRGHMPDIDIMYRRYCAKPQSDVKPGVTSFQYTVNRAGFFTPCDYSEMLISGLPRIDDKRLTKEMVDEAYARLSYNTEPCLSCKHKNCVNDWYEFN